jgi:hypothetical protein
MPEEYKVKQGDCISSIADKYNLSTETIWNHPDNAELKEKRKDPNILFKDDVIVIPDKETKEEACETGQLHSFRRKGIPPKVSLCLMDGDKHRKNLDYRIFVDGKIIKGKTDSKGTIDEFVPSSAKRGELVIDETGEKYNLELGKLDPISEESGIRQRFENLSKLRPGADQKEFESAIVNFKIEYCGLEIPEDGSQDDKAYEDYIKIDQKMTDKLLEIHGS